MDFSPLQILARAPRRRGGGARAHGGLLPERGGPPAADHDAGGVARRLRGVRGARPAAGREAEPPRAPLALPVVRHADHRDAEHPARELDRAGRQVRGVQGARSACATRSSSSSPGSSRPSSRGASAGARRSPRGSSSLGAHRGLGHRPRHPAPARPHHAAAAVAGPAREHRRGVRGPALGGAGGGRRLPAPLERLLGLQAPGGQGGHGLRRLQAARGAGRLDGVAVPAAHPPGVGRRRRGVGIALIWISGRGRDTRIPFGPYLAAGGLVALLWGREAVVAYLGRFPA